MNKNVFDLVSIKNLSERLEESSSLYAAVMRAKRSLTSQITGETREEKIESLCQKFSQSSTDAQEVRVRLGRIMETKSGELFFEDKVDEINRESFHRGALLANAALQLLTVDLLGLGTGLKAAMVMANLGLAYFAHTRMNKAKVGLLAGPVRVPPKPQGDAPNLDRWNVWRWLVGGKSKKQLKAELSYTREHLDHFEARDKRDLPYRASAKRELIYAAAYAVNSATLIFGASPITHYVINLPILDDSLTLVINIVAALGNAAAGVSSLILSGRLNAGAGKEHLTANGPS